MGAREMQLLTHSRQDCFKVCRKRHQFAYELGIRSRLDGKALRMGSAYHAGIESLGKGGSLSDAVESVRAHYGNAPDGFDLYDWLIECETVVRLICGYEWRWRSDAIKNIAAEQAFELPLLNPETNKPSTVFNLAGKIDGIVELPDGRLAVKECKLLGDDIGMDSELWRRLRIDHQISLYVLAARRLGYPVDCVLYDVSRKPTIGPTLLPMLDEEGLKIVRDRDGNRVRNAPTKPKNSCELCQGKGEKGECVCSLGSWRQTADKEKGYELDARLMTVEEWGDKLNNDIAARPEFYYARHEVPRLDQDLAEYESELWDIQQTIREAQRNERWYRTSNKNTCGFCSFFDLCTSGFDAIRDVLPEHFIKVTDLHPELERNANVVGS